MIHPRVDDLLQNVDSRYALVIVSAKRARQINNYHHQLGEGTFDDNPPPLVESRSKNYLTMAMEEVSEGLLTYATGRTTAYYDMPTVRRMVRETAAGDYRFSSLVLAVVHSDQFRMRRVPQPQSQSTH